MKNYVDKDKLQEYTTKLTAKQKTIFATKSEVGSPLVASTVAAMTDTSKVYVYVGSESGYTAGNWYYYDGTAWTSGGVYNSTAFETDTTLAIPGKAADAKAVGDALANVEIEVDATLTQAGMAADAKATGDAIGEVVGDVSDLKESFNQLLVKETIDGWEKGNFNTVTGANNPEDRYIRNQNFYGVYNGTTKIAVNSGYLMLLFAWTLDGTFVGSYKTTGVFDKTTANYAQISSFECADFPDYKIKISFKKDPASTEIATSEGQNCALYFLTDKSLTKGNKIADAKSTGEAIAELKDSSLGNLNTNVFELGNINISNSGWTWTASDSRVRLKSNVVLNLKPGDIIGLKSYSGYRYYVGWQDSSGNYGREGWKSADFTAPVSGRYVITVRKEPETEITDYKEIANLFKGFTVLNYTDNNFLKLDDEKLLPHNYFVKSVNHRGYMPAAPENTIPAFKLSRKQGFEYVETDVSFTSDNVPVLLHDDTINRTARNADGSTIANTIYINQITYEQALDYVFCGNYYGTYPTVKIPTLLEFVVLCRNLGLSPYIELKTSGNPTQAQIENCVDIVKSCGMLDKTTWISTDGILLGYVKNYSPHSRLGLVVSSINASIINGVTALKTPENDVFIDSSSLTDNEVSLCMQNNIPLEGWTIDAKETALNLNPYVSGITTSYLNIGKILFDNSIS